MQYSYVNYRHEFQGYPRKIADDWAGISRVDAAVTWQASYTQHRADSGETTYIFSGSQYYIFVNMMLARGYPKPIYENWGLPNDLDAAFQWSKNGLYYFTKGLYIFKEWY